MNSRKRSILLVLVAACFLTAAVSPVVAKTPAPSPLTVDTITTGLHVVRDLNNGNTVVFAGEDGVLVVDTKSQELSGALLGKIAEISDRPIRFVVNTHWHFDHVAGNEAFATTGATLISHENVRRRMSTEQKIDLFDMRFPPAPKPALPVVTFTRDLTLHLNGEAVRLFQVAPGHTDGDAIVYFPKANVIHVGDLYFNGLYPYIGVPTGGSIDAMIAVGRSVLGMIDDNTVIVPGHGPLAGKADYTGYLEMLTAIRNAVRDRIAEGGSKEAVIAAKPTRAFDEKWGHGFLKPDDFAGLVYMDLSRTASQPQNGQKSQ